jgi:hypothetical protein
MALISSSSGNPSGLPSGDLVVPNGETSTRPGQLQFRMVLMVW